MARGIEAQRQVCGSPCVLKYPYCHQRPPKPSWGQRGNGKGAMKNRIAKGFHVPLNNLSSVKTSALAMGRMGRPTGVT